MSMRRLDPGTERMIEIGEAINAGVSAFSRRAAWTLAFVVLAIAALLALINHGAVRLAALTFTLGAVITACASFIGAHIATEANIRAAAAARTGFKPAFNLVFRGSAIVGLGAAGLGLACMGLVFMGVSSFFGTDLARLSDEALPLMSGFVLGSAAVALALRAGGGAFANAASVGAALIHETEARVPDDLLANAAVVADYAGDVVGDVAGATADAVASFIAIFIAAMALAATGGLHTTELPLMLAGVGIIASLIGTLCVRVKEEGSPRAALGFGGIVSGLVVIVGSYVVTQWVVPEGIIVNGLFVSATKVWGAVTAGLVASILMGFATEYYCAQDRRPVREIVEASHSGVANAILAGLAVGKRSTFAPLIVIGITIIAGYQLAGLAGIAFAGIGMCTTVSMQLARAAFGPIAEHTRHIARLAGLDAHTCARTERLESAGRTAIAVGKAHAIAATAMATIALLAAFRLQLGMHLLDITQPEVMVGVLLGAALPFAAAAMTMRTVGRVADRILSVTRRQFKSIEGLFTGKARANYAECVDRASTVAFAMTARPAALGLGAVIVIGALSRWWWDDAGALGGVLIGAIASGMLMAIAMATSGAAWGAARHFIELEPVDTDLGTGKGSARHTAVLIGEMVGNPLKDATAPALTTIILAMCALSLVLAPLLK